jgi:excisionase family DNA binding protein
MVLWMFPWIHSKAIQTMNKPNQDLPTRLLTPPEAAKFLSVSKRTLDRLVAQGIVAVVRLGGSRRFTMSDLLETVYQNRENGSD